MSDELTEHAQGDVQPQPEDTTWMALALQQAERAAESGEVPVGAVIVRDGELLAVGANAQIGSTDPTAHAEIVALRAAAAKVGNYRLNGSTLYVTIEPCTMCAGALVHARIARLVYGASEPRAGAVHSSTQVLANAGLNHRVRVTAGVSAAAAGAQLRAFFAVRRARDADAVSQSQSSSTAGNPPS